MADSEIFKSAENGSLWILPSGPNTKPEYLPCFDLEDITESRGSITLIQCINDRGEYETLGATKAPPEPTTTTLGTYLGRTADWIETVRCPFALYVMLSCGKKGTFTNWDRSMLIDVKAVTNRTISNLVRKEEDVAAMHTFDVEAAPGVLDFFRLTSLPQSVDTLEGTFTSLRYSDDASCWDSCGSSTEPCEIGIATATAAAAQTAHVYLSPTLSGTASWTASAADPFIADEDIADGIIVKTGRNTNRLIVVRGTTDVANPLEIAYSDDDGTTWNLVDVGSTVAEFAVKKGALFALSTYDIFVVSNLGRIYKSEDGGLTWTVKEDAVITATEYHAIAMLNPTVGYAVGDTDTIVKTLDGGNTWGQVGATGGLGDLKSVAVLSRTRAWVSDDGGKMWYSTDGGTTWTGRAVYAVTEDINDQQWLNDYYGVVVGGGSVMFTINGGYSWEAIEDSGAVLSTDGLAVSVCSTRQIVSASGTVIVTSSI